jgi:hypothetical protein
MSALQAKGVSGGGSTAGAATPDGGGRCWGVWGVVWGGDCIRTCKGSPQLLAPSCSRCVSPHTKKTAADAAAMCSSRLLLRLLLPMLLLLLLQRRRRRLPTPPLLHPLLLLLMPLWLLLPAGGSRSHQPGPLPRLCVCLWPPPACCC